MTDTATHYDTLGVPETASPEDIKRAYRRLARESHPDRNPGDPAAEERFKALQEAYETVGDPARRAAYDRERRDPFGGARGGRASGESGFGSFGSGFAGADAGFDPLFSFFFSDPAGGARPSSSPADVETELALSFDQAIRGGKTEVRLPDGESVRLTIPRGVRSGLKVRVRGHGRPGAGGRGDLYVTFRVEPSGAFRREGDHLHLVESVSALEAIVGTTRQITNAYGQTVKVHIPAGTQPGERLRLRGQGVATDDRTGDLFVEVRVVVPRQLTDAQREALEATARRLGLL